MSTTHTVVEGVRLDVGISRGEVIEQLRGIISAQGDRIYEAPGDRCVYQDDTGTCSCLVGHWLALQGVPVDGLGLSLAGIDHVHYEDAPVPLDDRDARSVLRWLGYEESVVDLMEAVQERQDEGKVPWSVCLDHAVLATDQ